MQDADKIFSLYKEPNQKIIQLAAICSQEIGQVILRYSGSGEEGPSKALADLETKYGMPHLNLPILLTSLKETRTARSADDVPAVAESILNKLEAIATLQGNEDYVLPHASTMHVFRALRLGSDEELAVLDYIKRPNGVRLVEIKAWTRQRFEDLSLLRRTLHKAKRDHKAAHQDGGQPRPDVLNDVPGLGNGEVVNVDDKFDVNEDEYDEKDNEFDVNNDEFDGDSDESETAEIKKLPSQDETNQPARRFVPQWHRVP